jgi:porin
VAAAIASLALAWIATSTAAQGGDPAVIAVAGPESRRASPGLLAPPPVIGQAQDGDEGERAGAASDSIAPSRTSDAALPEWSSAFRAAGRDPMESPARLMDSLIHIARAPPTEPPMERIEPKHGIPSPPRGAMPPADLLRLMEEAREETFTLFPAVSPRLMPYLASLDEYGNTATQPGALIPVTLLDSLAQKAKLWLSKYGLRYSLFQTLTFVDMTDVVQGDGTIGYYNFNLTAKWALFDAPGAGLAGWLSAEVDAKTGLGTAGQTQSARSNLGTLTEPTGFWLPVNGFQLPELAWQQSLRGGEVVLLAGILDQSNYLDWNAYAGNTAGQFINSALTNTMVMPLPQYNFGVNLQWQPAPNRYAILGLGMGGAPPGSPPWEDFSTSHWSALVELGYAPDDLFGLGPGIYRIQPFLARAGGPTQGGLGFNVQQQLGRRSPVGYFGRFGFGGSDVSAGASAQVGTGLVVQAPLKYAGLLPRLSNDFFGVGFVWSRPSAISEPAVHPNEYVLEATYALQLTPTAKLQPDLQIIWNPARNPLHSRAVVFQLQLDVLW